MTEMAIYPKELTTRHSAFYSDVMTNHSTSRLQEKIEELLHLTFDKQQTTCLVATCSWTTDCM